MMTTILITGANRGIGLEFARQYAVGAADVIACCRVPDEATDLNALAKRDGNVRVAKLDVTNPQSVAALKEELGRAPIDILINNAGVGGSRERPKGIIDFDGWLKIFAANSVAPVMVAVALRDNLLAGTQKKLVTITSQLGSITNHSGGAFPYHASKAAVNSLMHGLSKDWARDGVTVGIFHPGWVQTDMGGAGAPVKPAESVKGLRAQIAALNAENSGSFRDYTGRELPW